MKKGLKLAVVFVASVLPVACSPPQEPDRDEQARREPPVTVIERTIVERVVVPAQTAEEATEENERAPEPTTTEASEPEPVYAELTDGALTVEIPQAWDESDVGAASEEGSSWTAHTGLGMASSVTAAPDLYAWSNGPESVGVYAVASGTLAQYYAVEDLVEVGPNDVSAACSRGARWSLQRDAYPGWVQEWTGCNGLEGSTLLTAAAEVVDGGCVVALQVGTYGEEEREAARHVLETFEADCGQVLDLESVYGVAATTPSAEEDAEDGSPYVPPPDERDGVCEGRGEEDPDCADAMREALEGQEREEQSPPVGGESVPPISEDACPRDYPVKGNQSGIYHDRDSPYYDVTDPEECFATAADAEADGYRAPLN